ncbi:hypothetical protein Dimus_023027, partial [Dionaea muscipula]
RFVGCDGGDAGSEFAMMKMTACRRVTAMGVIAPKNRVFNRSAKVCYAAARTAAHEVRTAASSRLQWRSGERL